MEQYTGLRNLQESPQFGPIDTPPRFATISLSLRDRPDKASLGLSVGECLVGIFCYRFSSGRNSRSSSIRLISSPEAGARQELDDSSISSRSSSIIANGFTLVELLVVIAIISCLIATWATAQSFESKERIETNVRKAAEANNVIEISLKAERPHLDPFNRINLDVLFTDPAGIQRTVPAFWAGGVTWKVRYASPHAGIHHYRTRCNDGADTGLHGVEGQIEIKPYGGQNPLYRFGSIQVAEDRRHLEHSDGTPFFWLGDTWWKGLAKRMTWEGFQELTSDRKAKGFTVVQMVAGPYPDQPPFDPRWRNEGGMPYEKDYAQVNPAYFDYADSRIAYLVESGIVPAIVGGWGWHMPSVGVEKMKLHWRYLIARYSAYPVIWIIGGEAGGPQWTDVARYVRNVDPYRHLTTVHPIDSGRKSVTDETVIDLDMLQTGHGDWDAASNAIPKLKAAYSRTPVMPVLVGEACYEGHMQTAFQDVQRYVFWGCMLSGAAGHTYGAAGVWHASVDGDPGITPVYDFTTWREGMNYPGSTQLGLGKKLLQQYRWWRFEPHPEWAELGSFAAGISGEVRFIYQPRRGVYNWKGAIVKKLERDVPYHGFYFNPGNGKRYDLGTFSSAGPPPKPFDGHTLPLLFVDRFDQAGSSAWKDYGTPSQRTGGSLVGGKGMVTILEKVDATNLMASVEANSNAEAGIILRFHDPETYLVALYSPSLRSIFIHDRKNGQWGNALGQVEVPYIGSKIHLTAAACGDCAALVLTDGKRTYSTPTIKIGNVTSGKAGVWLYQIGERQEFANFELSRTQFASLKRERDEPARALLWSDEYKAPGLPSPQDWVLVLERVKP